MEKYKELIKQVYESDNVFKSIPLPAGTTMGMVSDYIANSYKDKNGRPAYYGDCECREDGNTYYWDNYFAAYIDIWSGEISIWKD